MFRKVWSRVALASLLMGASCISGCLIGPDPCASHSSSCGDCAPTSGCGWCAATSECMSGHSSGPSYGTCSSGWTWSPGDCAGGGCPAGSISVRWNNQPGVCSQLCSSNSECASGMCNRLSDGRFACFPSSTSQGSCSPACASSQICVRNGSGGASCLDMCSSNSDCGTSCCASLTDGRRVCADASQCSTSTTCHDRTSCVTMTSSHPTGAGHCAGEVTGQITNNCSDRVTCGFSVDGTGSGSVDVSPGSTIGGELGGIWDCGHSSGSNYVYRCALTTDPSTCSTP